MLSPKGATWKDHIYKHFGSSTSRLGRFWTVTVFIVRNFNNIRGIGIGFDSHRPLLDAPMSQAAQVGLANKLVGMEDSVLSPNAIQTVLKTTRNYHKTPDDVRH